MLEPAQNQQQFPQVDPTSQPWQQDPFAPVPEPAPAEPSELPQAPYTNTPLRPQLPPEEMILSWEAPNRPFKKRDREYYTTIAIIVFLLSIILFFAGQFLLIAVIVAFAFVSYMLASIPPENTVHTISTYGIRTGNQLYHWGELGRFWFTERLGHKILNIEYFHRIIGRLVFVLGAVPQEEMKSVLLEFLPNETPLPTFVDKASAWIQKKFPLDKNG